MQCPRLDFDEHYRTYRKAVVRAVYNLLRDWQQAEDIAQEAFLLFYRRCTAGERIERPRAYVQTIAYYLSVRFLRSHGRRQHVPTAEETLHELLERQDTRSLAADEPDGRAASLPSLIFWGRRMIDEATVASPPLQRERLRILMDSASRPEALEKLAGRGDPWARSSVSMTLARYSQKIDRFLHERLERGPICADEELHWPFLERLRRECPWLRLDPAAACHSTLAWLIQGMNELEPDLRGHIVRCLFEPRSAPPQPRPALAGRQAVPLAARA